ncbi:MAG TPA: tyrosinase family protein [Pyrinomonadaceae bacterium]|jgi:tyrosinase
MSIQILINNNPNPESNYITWTPIACRIVSDENVQKVIVLSNKHKDRGGQIVFSATQPANMADTLQLTIPPGGSANFFIAGKTEFINGNLVTYPSENDKDAIILITDAVNNTSLGEKPLMVRVRKNANQLTANERNRFLDAIVRLNQSGAYFEFQNMHLDDNTREIHFRSCFLPWHRAFLLDIERKLQATAPENRGVTVPYWKFDEPAPNVFIRAFMGVPLPGNGAVDFTNTNPLINWRVQIAGIGSNLRIRRSYHNNSSAANPANNRAIGVQNNERQTLNLGNIFAIFARQPVNQFDAGGIEGDPHGSAHGSFNGEISEIGKAPADPLFFLLHCNVDRLWAKWQYVNNLFRPNDTNAYPRQGNGNPASNRESGIGNFTNDTMWSWNRISRTQNPNRPVPGTEMPDSPLTNLPGRRPTVGSMIDYQGQFSLANNLHFAYDNVPFF